MWKNIKMSIIIIPSVAVIHFPAMSGWSSEVGTRGRWNDIFCTGSTVSLIYHFNIELAKKYSQVLYQLKMKISLLFTIVLLTSPSLRSSSAATLGNVTTEELLEPSCRSCGGECRAYDIERDGGRCKCNADCEVYGDCCGPSSTRRSAACEGTSLEDSRLNHRNSNSLVRASTLTVQ